MKLVKNPVNKYVNKACFKRMGDETDNQEYATPL